MLCEHREVEKFYRRAWRLTVAPEFILREGFLRLPGLPKAPEQSWE